FCAGLVRGVVHLPWGGGEVCSEFDVYFFFPFELQNIWTLMGRYDVLSTIDEIIYLLGPVIIQRLSLASWVLYCTPPWRSLARCAGLHSHFAEIPFPRPPTSSPFDPY